MLLSARANTGQLLSLSEVSFKCTDCFWRLQSTQLSWFYAYTLESYGTYRYIPFFMVLNSPPFWLILAVSASAFCSSLRELL